MVLITVAFAGFRWWSAERGYIDHGLGVVLMTMFSILALTGVVLWTVRRLRALSSGARQTERDLLYRTVARNSPSGSVQLFDRDLRYLLVEGATLRALDAGPEQLEGKTIWEALEPDVAAQVEPAYRAALAGQTTAFEMPFRGHFFRVTVAPTVDDANVITGGDRADAGDHGAEVARGSAAPVAEASTPSVSSRAVSHTTSTTC